MLEGKTLAVVMPAFCEEALIGEAIARVPPCVDRIWVVDDASTDDTRAAAMASPDARVRVLSLARNRGVGAAIAEGYRAAFGEGADAACVMAGDAQMDPRDLEALALPVLAREADYVVGDRLAWPGARGRMPLPRFLGNHALSALTRLTLGLPVGDSQCGYTALGREGWSSLELAELWPRYGYPNDLLALAKRAGLRIETRPVRPVYGREKSGVRLHHALFVVPYVLGRARLRGLRRASLPLAARPDAPAR